MEMVEQVLKERKVDLVKAIELRKKSTNELLNDMEIYVRVLAERKHVDAKYLTVIIGDLLQILDKNLNP
jgi:hypothetical protein